MINKKKYKLKIYFLFYLISLLSLFFILSVQVKEKSQTYLQETNIIIDTQKSINNEQEKVAIQEITTMTVLTTESETEKVTSSSINQENIKEKTTVKEKNNSNFGYFKSYTDYKKISKTSAQWKLQEQAYTDENGLRKIGDCYLVALGSYYGTELGQKYSVTLSNGSSFYVILCDCKMDKHTDETHRYTVKNNCVIEFYVDSSKLPKKVKTMGNIGAIEFFNGTIENIEKVK